MICFFLNHVIEISAVVSVIILLWTGLEVRKATHANTYKILYDIVQSDSIRDARDFVLLTLKGKSIDTWTADDIKIARKVCQAYDAIGQIARNGFLPTKIIADSWGPSLREAWKFLSPYITSFRLQINAANYWDDFEWLARKAIKYDKPIRK